MVSWEITGLTGTAGEWKGLVIKWDPLNMNEETTAGVWGEAAKVSVWPQHGVMSQLYSYSQCQAVHP